MGSWGRWDCDGMRCLKGNYKIKRFGMEVKMERVIEKFLAYVKIDTESSEGSTTMPSTMKQHDLATLLEKELREMGAEEITYDKEHCYV